MTLEPFSQSKHKLIVNWENKYSTKSNYARDYKQRLKATIKLLQILLAIIRALNEAHNKSNSNVSQAGVLINTYNVAKMAKAIAVGAREKKAAMK